jgi:ribosomal protein S12 methylthiotransferase accessory factor
LIGEPEPSKRPAPGFPERAVPPALFVDTAREAARPCGVTRLADITGLDRIGLPVWQTVRPASRALSVHQGKGATPLEARIGALCEAIESHAAEEAPADGPVCAHAALPPANRASDLTDYLRDRGSMEGADEPVAWCRAHDLVGGGALFLPHPLVSLDFTIYPKSPFDRSSTGLAAGTSEEEALFAALLEVVERDAVTEWERCPPAARMARTVPVESIRLDWFCHWRERLAANGAAIAVHAPQAIVSMPVFAAAISGPSEFGVAPRAAGGSGAHPDPEIALFRALAEAIQSRLTLIAGARDDILPGDYATPPGLGLPTPPVPADFGGLRWNDFTPGVPTLAALVEALAARGYGQVAAKRLGTGLTGIHVAKVFVPGLGAAHRTRRIVR